MTADFETERPLIARSPYRRPLHKRVVHVLRRGHLYFGLLLFPWAILYGVTAFLFNHPTAFSDQPTLSFGADAVSGTPLESLPTPTEQAARVVALLNERQKPVKPYVLGDGEPRYSREFAFATVKGDGRTVSLLFDVKNGGGTIRTTVDKPKDESPPIPAPFAVGNAGGPPRAGRGAGEDAPRPSRSSDGLLLENPLHERVKAAIPTILERSGVSGGDVTVTSVPELVFPIRADGRTWTAAYNPMTGSVSGKPADADEKPELSARRFLTQLHKGHGYPGEMNARWYWAVVVDAMAFVMCFWGLTGLIMWWQIKATRIPGAVVLAVSAAAAVALGFAMHSAMTS